jgi:hypothetical protein
MIKTPNLRIHSVEEGAEIQNKGMGNIFNKIIAENFPNLCNYIDTHVEKSFWTPDRHDQKRITPCIIIIKMPK